MPDQAKQQLLNAILPHVAFDGWSPEAFRAAVEDTEMTIDQAKLIYPRGAVDLAVQFHLNGDAAMVAQLKATDMSDMRFRDKVAHAIRLRLDAVNDKEAVRRGSTLFALPHMAPEGAKLIWGTADAIWTTLGDTSDDINWYTKRATLSGVYGSVVLYWLGDDSLEGQATDAFIDRRIDNVMQFEIVKAGVNNNPFLKPFTGPLGRMMSKVKAPTQTPRDDLPGRWVNPS